MKRHIFSDMLLGAAMTLAVLFFYFSGTGIEPLELKFYDFRARLNSRTTFKNEIAIIEINDDSISKIGNWPWPRSRVADMLTLLSTGTARPAVIGLNILFPEPERNADLETTDRLRLKYRELVAAKKIKETTKESEFDRMLSETRKDMDNDARLAAAIAGAGNVVLAMSFNTDEIVAKPRPAPDWLKKYSAAARTSGASDTQMEGSDFAAPLEILAASAAGIGHVNVFKDSDGAVRKEYPFIFYDRNFYPSFAEELARIYLKLKPSEALITPGRRFALGARTVPLDYESAMLIAFSSSKTSFKYYSFYDVMSDKIVPEAFKDKIVLIGLTAGGAGSRYATPAAMNLPAVEVFANVTENILSGRFILRPPWARQAETGLIAVIGLVIIFLLPRLQPRSGAVLAALILAGLSGAGVYLFKDKGLWIKTAYPSCLLIAGYIVIAAKSFLSGEKKKTASAPQARSAAIIRPTALIRPGPAPAQPEPLKGTPPADVTIEEFRPIGALTTAMPLPAAPAPGSAQNGPEILAQKAEERKIEVLPPKTEPPAPKMAISPDFEKTLPLIYPGKEKK